ncbi:MAG: binding-protein-dependent transport system inner rane component [Chloroflexi bacterium]|nr:binding-protein-dependent transport system inner rane component [Chloroflexota bacterium]
MRERLGTRGFTPRRTVSAVASRRLAGSLSLRLLFHILMLACCVVVLVPFVWMVSSSFKTPADVITYPPDWIPNPIITDNYPQSLSLLPMGHAYFNSFKISMLDTIGGLLTCSMAAYAFARLRFRGRDVLFIAVLSALMIPQEVNLIPLYILFKQIGWIDTHWPLIVPPILQNPYGIFLLRQFFLTIPTELEDAARIDGANPWTIYTRIILPLAGPAMITLGIFIFLYNWNQFLTPLIYLNSQDNFTVPMLINSYLADYGQQWGLMMAACTIAMAPMIAVYAIGQRYFIEGIAVSGLKG